MNLTISGPIDDSLLNALANLVKPAVIVRLHSGAYRLEGVKASSEINTSVAAACQSARVDHTYLSSGSILADYKLLAFDMDSTLITIECIDEMADFAGRKGEVAAITERTMSGDIKNFAESLRRRVALLAGMKQDVMRQVFEERLKLSPGADSVVEAAKLTGLKIAIFSGGFDYFAYRLKQDLRLDFAFANTLEIREGYLTGRILGPIVDASRKARLLVETARHTRCDLKEAIVIGDGVNDIQMMKAVAFSVAYKAKPAVQTAAAHSIRFGPLSTLIDWLPASSGT